MKGGAAVEVGVDQEVMMMKVVVVVAVKVALLAHLLQILDAQM